MLELVGSEEKDTKVKVKVELDSDGDICIYYDGICVACIEDDDGRVSRLRLDPNEVTRLKAKSIDIWNGHIRSN